MDIMTCIEHALIEIIQINDGDMRCCSLRQYAERACERCRREENEQDPIEDKRQTLPIVRILNGIVTNR